MAKAQELRDLTVDDLRQRQHQLDDELFRMRMQKAMGQLEGPGRLRTVRRDLARVKTVLRELESSK
ncbi:MAG: 50S ribosomal protein L29 [Vicinamibacterales bacterium]